MPILGNGRYGHKGLRLFYGSHERAVDQSINEMRQHVLGDMVEGDRPMALRQHTQKPIIADIFVAGILDPFGTLDTQSSKCLCAVVIDIHCIIVMAPT